MKDLIVIGNGFDLAHGLPTSYSNFIIWYLNKIVQKACGNIFSEDKLIRISHDFGKPISYRKFNEIKEFQETCDKLKLKIEYNSSFFRKLINLSINSKWKDIEAEYYFELLRKFRVAEQKYGEGENEMVLEMKRFNEVFAFIKMELVEYLKTISIVKDLKIPEIEHHFENLTIVPENALVLNFNYTTTPELYISRGVEIIYIHGKLSDSKNPIIFGYGDEMDAYYPRIERLNHNEWIKHFKSFSYSKSSNYQKLFGKIPPHSKFNVHIMGHSCGISDRVLFNSIIELENCHRIYIYYYEKDGNNDFYEKTMELSRHFKPEFKHKMRLKIAPFDDPFVKPLMTSK